MQPLEFDQDLEGCVLAAAPNVSYASRMFPNLNRWVMSLVAAILCDCTVFSSIGVVTVSTSLVVIVSGIRRSRNLRFRPFLNGLLPWAIIDERFHGILLDVVDEPRGGLGS